MINVAWNRRLILGTVSQKKTKRKPAPPSALRHPNGSFHSSIAQNNNNALFLAWRRRGKVSAPKLLICFSPPFLLYFIFFFSHSYSSSLSFSLSPFFPLFTNPCLEDPQLPRTTSVLPNSTNLIHPFVKPCGAQRRGDFSTLEISSLNPNAR
ncbi:MAG: hypothetical protein J3R72DRAFT_39943 [Linnemannia gamsii]|nr:MAG: hypothetical protein J3R72DRAFT_39943 [Linnemannia gamsii]